MTPMQALAEVLKTKLGETDAQRHLAGVQREIMAARETWSDTQVRTRNLLVITGAVIGVVVGFVVARLVG